MVMKANSVLMGSVLAACLIPLHFSYANAAVEPTEQVNVHELASKAQAARPYYKPGAPVAITSPSEYEITPGTPLKLELALRVAGHGETHLSLVPSAGLALHSSNEIQFEGGQKVIVLEVSTDRYDLSHLRIFAEFEDAKGFVSSRAMSLAFDSRTQAQRAKPGSFQSKDVVVMPATETVR